MRSIRWLVICGFAALVFAVAVAQDEDDAARVLFIANDDQGTVWANLGLALQNRSDAYIPMVVGVQNNSPTDIKLTRESFHLADMDGVVYSMPSVKEWRKGYKRIVIDRRLVSTGGIPWRVWDESGRLARSNFFPDLSGRRGNTAISTINLRTGYGMVDLMYFEQMRGQQAGRPFILGVHPEGWEVPINLRLYLN